MATTGHIAFVVTSKPMLHLLFGDASSTMGGAELQLFLHARHLVENGWAVTFVVGNYEDVPVRADAHGMKIVRSPLPAPGGPLGRLNGLRKFQRSLRTVDADVYVTRGASGQAGVIAWFCKRQARKCVFWFAKDSDIWCVDAKRSEFGVLESAMAAYGLRNSAEIVVQSEQQQGLVKEYIGRAGHIIRNVCPVPDERPSEPVAASAQQGSYVLWVGSLQPKKRPAMLFEIADALPDQAFVMLGGGLPKTQDFAAGVQEELQRHPNIDYKGFVPYAETEQYFRQAFLFLNTSEPELEGFPNTYLQAWACGVPVVGTCNPDQVITRFGLGISGADVESLSSAIVELSEDATRYSKLSRAAREYVREYHSEQAVFGSLDRFLCGLIGGGD